MHCTNCGAEMPDKSKFCPSCGTGADNSGGEATSSEAKVEKKSESSKGETIGGIVALAILGIWWFSSSGMDIDLSYCEHRMSDCKWDGSTMASCTITNEARVPISLMTFKTWSYSDSGVLLQNMSIGTDTVSPGRSAKAKLYFDKDADRAYVCSVDPESKMGKAITKDVLKPLKVS